MRSTFLTVSIVLVVVAGSLAQTVPRFEARASFQKVADRDYSLGAHVLVGPQDALYMRWTFVNARGEGVRMPSPEGLVSVTVTSQAGPFPVSLLWDAETTHRDAASRRTFIQPLGPLVLNQGSSSTVHLTIRRANGESFPPGDYQVRIDSSRLIASLMTLSSASWKGQATGSSTNRVTVKSLSTLEDVRLYHRVEASFFTSRDPTRTLQHRLALIELPDATFGDRVALGEAFARLERYREAIEVYRPLLSELVASASNPDAALVQGKLLTTIARSFLAIGDDATARMLVEAEGLVPPEEVPAYLERIRPVESPGRRIIR